MTSTVHSKITRTQILATLFAAYGQANDEKRLAAYSLTLKDIPEDLLMRACHKLMLEKTFIPAIAEIVQACRSLVGSVDDSKRERAWMEAWEEIKNQVQECGRYDKPKWSTPEIAATVKSYGYIDLCDLNRDELQTASAQCRRYYEEACSRKNEQSVNDYVLKKISGAEMIGLLPEQKIIMIHERK